MLANFKMIYFLFESEKLFFVCQHPAIQINIAAIRNIAAGQDIGGFMGSVSQTAGYLSIDMNLSIDKYPAYAEWLF